METTKSTVKVGLIGVGLNTYWEQFEGLLPRLLGYQKEIKEKMHRLHADVVDTGMVDTPQKAIDATTLMQNNGIEIAFYFYLDLCTFIYNPPDSTTYQSSDRPIKCTTCLSY